MPRKPRNDDIERTVGDLLEYTRQLDDKQLRKVIKRSVWAAARVLGRKASAEISHSGVHNARLIAKTVRVGVSRDLRKMYATVLPRPSVGGRKGGFHLNRFGKWKPVAHFLNVGATDRQTRRGYNRGSIAGKGYIDSAETSATTQAVDALIKMYEKQVNKIVNSL